MTADLPDPASPTDPEKHAPDEPSIDALHAGPDPVAEASWLRRRAHRLLGAEARRGLDTQDVVQHAQLEAWRRRGTNSFTSRGALRAWLDRVAANFVRGEGRRARPLRADTVQLNGACAEDSTPSHRAGAREQLTLVRERLSELPERTRRVVELRMWDGLPHAEIAERLDISTEHARVLYHRGLNALRADSQPTERESERESE